METIGPTGDTHRMLVSAYLGPVQPDGERYVDGIIEDMTAVGKADGLFDDLVGHFHRAKSIMDIQAARGRLIELVPILLESGADPRQIYRRYTVLSDIALEWLIGLAVEQLDDPPASFVFLAFGSEGRGEQTLGSDQDNTILDANGAPGDPAVVHAWFHSLGTRVCGWLAEMGVRPCKGGMMASNPRWCAPISEWESMFGRWISEPEPRELLDFQVFFDFRAVYGEGSLLPGFAPT